MTTATTPPSLSTRELDELVRQHLPLVGYAVNDLCRRLPAHVRRDDLESAGMAALALAATGFEAERGVPFARYASRRIQGALLDELRQVDWASRSVRRRAREQDDVVDQLVRELGHQPTAAEIAGRMGVSRDEVESVQHDVHRSVVLSFQVAIAAAGADTILPSNEPTPEQVIVDREREAYLHDAVALLPERLRSVVLGLFYDERPTCEVAAELGVTESRVSQMRTEALGLLREAMTLSLSPEMAQADPRPDGRVSRRKQAYYAEVAARSSFAARVSVPMPRHSDELRAARPA